MTARRRGWIGRAGGLSLGVILPIVISAPAAAEVSEDVRGDVAALVEDLTGVSGLSYFEYDRLDIDEDGSGYRATLAGVRLQPNADAHLEVGSVVLALDPEPDGYRITGIELPSTIPVLSSDGSPAGQVQFARLGLTGKWHRSTSVLVEADLTLDELVLDSPADAFTEAMQVTIETATLRSRLAPAADGTWREEVTADVRELRNRQGDAADTLSGFLLEGVTEGIDLERQRQLQQLMVGASQNAMAADAGVDPTVLASMRALSDTIRATRFKLSAQGLQVDQGGAQPIVVPNAEFSLSAEGLDGASARTDLHIKIDEADMPLAEHSGGAVPEAMGPQSLELNIAVDALPWPALWEAFIDVSFAAAPEEEGAWRLGLALQDAGTRLQLMPSRLSSEATMLTGNGEVRGDPAAAFGAVASFAFEIVGLSAAQTMAMESPDGELALGVLGQLDAMGKPSPGADGSPVHRYDIVLGADGVLTVNGEPFTFGEPGIDN
jgi:hypothetical protein